MVDFRRRRKVTTRRPGIRVDPGLPVGRYLCRLTVVDAQGNRSQRAVLKLEIVAGPRRRRPRRVDPATPQPVGPGGPAPPADPSTPIDGTTPPVPPRR